MLCWAHSNRALNVVTNGMYTTTRSNVLRMIEKSLAAQTNAAGQAEQTVVPAQRTP